MYPETMLMKGNGDGETAMAKTVGFPIAVLAEGMLDKRILIISGVQMSIHESVYAPVLKGLEALGIGFGEGGRDKASPVKSHTR